MCTSPDSEIGTLPDFRGRRPLPPDGGSGHEAGCDHDSSQSQDSDQLNRIASPLSESASALIIIAVQVQSWTWTQPRRWVRADRSDLCRRSWVSMLAGHMTARHSLSPDELGVEFHCPRIVIDADPLVHPMDPT
jgi:hypothetical protein